jgi:2-oxoglutarate ferredoxin oxidoreductase subunit alpha
MLKNRVVVKFAGESGQGINTLGEIISKSIKDAGFYNFAYREYPSLIKGGVASYQIDISDSKIASSSRSCEILSILDIDSFHTHLETVKQDGVVIHSIKDFELSKEEQKYVNDNDIHIVFLDTKKKALEVGGTEIMMNMVLLGFIWKLLDLDTDPLEGIVKEFFQDKDVDIETEIKCIMAGYNSSLVKEDLLKPITFKSKKKLDDALSITGNQAIALGAISAGCRAYYAYPMTPATSILKFLGNTYKETGILIKQAESEITAAQMVMGSMNMGTRAMTATSGGGFDLMSETISCAGMSETPTVIVLAQRTGPGTGVPTWTGASDLLLAINAGHSEFPRCVISISNPKDAYILTQEAFNIAETYQLPVIVLTEKQIAESIFNIDKLPKPIKIERGFKKGKERYEITKSGISPRWIPSENNPTVLVNSDEHKPNGVSTENSQEIIQMSDKRMRKLETLKYDLPEPEYFGNKKPKTVLIGYGSVGNIIKDVLRLNSNIGYLHYKYMYPFKFRKILEFKENGTKIVTVENNQTGQLQKLIARESGILIDEKIIKYNGRPLFVEDILDYLNQ